MSPVQSALEKSQWDFKDVSLILDQYIVNNNGPLLSSKLYFLKLFGTKVLKDLWDINLIIKKTHTHHLCLCLCMP